MLHERIIPVLLVIVVLSICIGAVSANENLTDDQLIADDGDNLGNFTQISEKIENADENDVVELNGTYESVGDKICVSKSLTIDGKNKTTLDAKGLSGIFEVNGKNLTLKNLKFINSNGSVIFSVNSKIIIDNCVFVNNNAAVINSGNCLITNCLFENNAGEFGSLYIQSNSKLINNTFNNNHASRFGGAAYLFGDNIVLINNTFTNNRAFGGGALYIASRNTLVQGGSFKSNVAKSEFSDWENGGGAIYIASDGVNICDTVFDDNFASDNGGAIYWCGENGTANNVTFKNNHAGDGGALLVKGNDVKVTNSLFSNNYNSGQYYRGAIVWTGDYGVMDKCVIKDSNAPQNMYILYWMSNYGLINNTLFNKNKVTNNAAVYLYGNHFTVSNSNFTENTGVVCDIHGGYATIDNINFFNNNGNNEDVYLFGCSGSYITLKNSNFKNNALKNSYAVVSTFGMMTTVLNSNFVNNTGGLTMVGHILDNCTFINNKGVSLDVGQMDIQAFDINTHVVKNSIFKDNVGSALSVSDRNLALANCEFINNNANENGGAVYWYATGGYLTNNSFTSNSAKKLGGAIYFGRIGNNMVGNIFKDNKASDFNDFYGDFEFTILKSKLYVDEPLKFKVVDKTTKRLIDGIYSVFDLFKGKKYLLTTSGKTKDGVATVNMKGLAPGSYILGIDCLIIEDYGRKDIKIVKAPTTVKAPKLTAKYKKSINFKITIKNKITKTPVKKEKIKVKVGKRIYNLKTDANGIIKFNTKKLTKGTYKVKITSDSAKYKISASSKIKIK